jgi:hypothetical protein
MTDFREIYIVTYKGFAWLIIMGSGFDYWAYWHFCTITVDCNCSHIELLNNVCLTNLCEESLTNLGLISMHEWTPFYNSQVAGIEITMSNIIILCYSLFHPLPRIVCQSRGNALISPSMFVAAKRVNLVASLWFIQAYSLLRNALLANRCLAMDYSVTILRGTYKTL